MLETALSIFAVIGYALWFLEWRKRRKLIHALQILQVSAQNTAKSPFSRREAKQIVGAKCVIIKTVKSLERLKVPNEKKRMTILKLCEVKLPGVGVGVIDTAIKEALKEIR